jgi:hypothetical protein
VSEGNSLGHLLRGVKGVSNLLTLGVVGKFCQ